MRCHCGTIVRQHNRARQEYWLIRRGTSRGDGEALPYAFARPVLNDDQPARARRDTRRPIGMLPPKGLITARDRSITDAAGWRIWPLTAWPGCLWRADANYPAVRAGAPAHLSGLRRKGHGRHLASQWIHSPTGLQPGRLSISGPLSDSEVGKQLSTQGSAIADPWSGSALMHAFGGGDGMTIGHAVSVNVGHRPSMPEARGGPTGPENAPPRKHRVPASPRQGYR
jgi:hypothetical protein